ncbi:MAG: anti-sigma factor [Proteobacteria bacterium]|nr:anti-sigma factor [Pseudomonadota bacterium]
MSRERLNELLADRATQGLDDVEQRELDGLLLRLPDTDADELDRCAAAIDLALVPVSHEPLPAHLRERVLVDARAYLASGDATRARWAAPREVPSAPSKTPWAAPAGWLAAAAILVFALLGVVPPLLEPAPPNPVDARNDLLANQADAIRIAWTATGDPAGPEATGDVVWSDQRQQGYMRFSGLAANDPSVSQYQLWIFDATRDERHPVDGGVFDIPAGETEVVVPIHARLPVAQAALFAITVERPGGVVVSTRERLPLLAKVDG